MSPPSRRPLPRFIGGASEEALPQGRWAERLAEELRGACEPLAGEAGAAGPDEITWYPERTWGARAYVPSTGTAEGTSGTIEFFGLVSFERPEGGEPRDFRASADFTDVLAEENPDWNIDLNEEVLGRYIGDSGLRGAVTLVWGRPLVRGAAAATAELDGEVVDQTPIPADRFTLLALDALDWVGSPDYLEVVLWNKRGVELARESLYDDDSSEPGPDSSAGPGPDSSAG